MLVLVERKYEVAQYRLKVRNKLVPCILFEGCEGTASCFLDTFVVVENNPKELWNGISSRSVKASYHTYTLERRHEELVLVLV